MNASNLLNFDSSYRFLPIASQSWCSGVSKMATYIYISCRFICSKIARSADHILCSEQGEFFSGAERNLFRDIRITAESLFSMPASTSVTQDFEEVKLFVVARVSHHNSCTSVRKDR